MSRHIAIRIENSMDAIAAAQRQIGEWFDKAKVPARTQNFVRLAIEEIATNWIKYGCIRSSEHAMIFDLRIVGDLLILECQDNGAPFDPLAFPDPENSLPLGERKPGGLGILLLRKMADRLSYEHRNGMNILRIEKFIHPLNHEQT